MPICRCRPRAALRRNRRPPPSPPAGCWTWPARRRRPSAGRLSRHGARHARRAGRPEYLASDTPGWEGILKHGVYHTEKGLGVDESVMWGEFFFVEALTKVVMGDSEMRMTGAEPVEIRRNPTRSVPIGSMTIGGDHPIAVQSMTATSTRNVAATVEQVQRLATAGADVVRIAVDSRSRCRSVGRDPPANDGQSVGRPAGELPAGRSRRTARRQDPLQPGPPVSPRAREAVAGQGAVPGRQSPAGTTVRCGSA